MDESSDVARFMHRISAADSERELEVIGVDIRRRADDGSGILSNTDLDQLRAAYVWLNS